MPEIPPRKPIADAALSVVLAATASTGSLTEVVQSWAAFLSENKRNHEIIVVVQREQAGAGLQATTPGVRIVVEENPRQGAQLRSGLQAARHPLLLFAPADLAWKPEFLEPLLARIDAVDLVSGCRSGRKLPPLLAALGFCYRGVVRLMFGIPLDPWPGWLGWRGHLYQRFVRVLFGTRLSDVACPFKLFRREALQRMPIQSNSSFVHTELMAKSNFLSCLVDEAPLPVPATAERDHWLSDFHQVFRDPQFGPSAGQPPC